MKKETIEVHGRSAERKSTRVTVPLPDTMDALFSMFENQKALLEWAQKHMLLDAGMRLRVRLNEEGSVPPIQEIRYRYVPRGRPYTNGTYLKCEILYDEPKEEEDE